jgi:hypothetical protein
MRVGFEYTSAISSTPRPFSVITSMSSLLPFPILPPITIFLPVVTFIQILQSFISINISFILYIFHPLLREVETVCGRHSCAQDCGNEEDSA